MKKVVEEGRRCLHLERFAGGCDLRSITAGVQTTPEDSSVPPQLSEHYVLFELCFPSLTVVLAVFFILRPHSMMMMMMMMKSGHLSSCRTAPLSGQYQIILLGDRGTVVASRSLVQRVTS